MSKAVKGGLVAQLVGVASVGTLIYFMGSMVSFGGNTPLASELSRLLVIGVLFGLWGVFYLVMRLRAKKKNTKLMTQLSMPAVSPEGSAMQEAKGEEIAALNERFDDALQLLKKTQPAGKKNRLYLYDLPWYVVIGAPGSGKTTLLLNSGLEFPLSDRLGKSPVKGVGGTRDCDWFFTDEAIFLDTAGRFTTQDSYQPVDKAAWSFFLDMLKKCRPRRPINGVMLTMSIPDLMTKSDDERRKSARDLRQRIMELYEVLGNRFPVYMLLTKCDLVAGFNEFFTEVNA